MARVSGTAWPWLLADDSERIIGVRAPDGYDTYLVQQWYGAWRSTQVQEIETEGTPQAITFNVTDFASGITLTNSSQITVDADGVYELSASIQLSNDSGQIHNCKFWVRVASVDAPNSSRIVYVPAQHAGGPGHATLGASYFFPLKAGQVVQVMWSPDTDDVTLDVIAADGGPAAPSVFVTMARIA